VTIDVYSLTIAVHFDDRCHCTIVRCRLPGRVEKAKALALKEKCLENADALLELNVELYHKNDHTFSSLFNALVSQQRRRYAACCCCCSCGCGRRGRRCRHRCCCCCCMIGWRACHLLYVWLVLSVSSAVECGAQSAAASAALAAEQ
jgi:hypothetical protein